MRRLFGWLLGREDRCRRCAPRLRQLRWELKQMRAANDALDELLDQARLEYHEELNLRRGTERTVSKLKQRLIELRRESRTGKRAPNAARSLLDDARRARERLERQRDRERDRSTQLESQLADAERRTGAAERYARELERRLQELAIADAEAEDALVGASAAATGAR